MINISNLNDLLSSAHLLQVETAIASNMNCELYDDDKSILIDFMNKEIEQSGLSVETISYFIMNNSKEIIYFAEHFLSKYKPEVLSIGISITYGIYMIYLREKSENELLSYLKKRRIPKPSIFLKELLSLNNLRP